MDVKEEVIESIAPEDQEKNTTKVAAKGEEGIESIIAAAITTESSNEAETATKVEPKDLHILTILMPYECPYCEIICKQESEHHNHPSEEAEEVKIANMAKIADDTKVQQTTKARNLGIASTDPITKPKKEEIEKPHPERQTEEQSQHLRKGKKRLRRIKEFEEQRNKDLEVPRRNKEKYRDFEGGKTDAQQENLKRFGMIQASKNICL